MIDPSLRAVLRSRYTIRRFFLTFGLFLGADLLLLISATAGLSPGWLRDSATIFLGTFAATLAVFLVTYAFYIFVTPPGLRNATVIPLGEAEIAEEIIDLPAHAADYWFWGRSGSYFRAEILPRLDNLARTERKHVHVRVLIPDPDRDGNSSLYKHIRQGLGEKADDNTLKANVIATIMAVAKAASRNPYLRADIALCATVPVIRYDMSNAGALLTRDAKELPAILVNSNNPYFEMFRDAVESEFAQSRRLSWDAGKILVDDDGALTEASLTGVVGMPKYTDETIAIVRELLASGKHRYVR
jgi:hypothetical protein